MVRSPDQFQYVTRTRQVPNPAYRAAQNNARTAPGAPPQATPLTSYFSSMAGADYRAPARTPQAPPVPAQPRYITETYRVRVPVAAPAPTPAPVTQPRNVVPNPTIPPRIGGPGAVPNPTLPPNAARAAQASMASRFVDAITAPNTIGRVAGGALGTLVGGPVGGLLGALAGNYAGGQLGDTRAFGGGFLAPTVVARGTLNSANPNYNDSVFGVARNMGGSGASAHGAFYDTVYGNPNSDSWSGGSYAGHDPRTSLNATSQGYRDNLASTGSGFSSGWSLW